MELSVPTAETGNTNGWNLQYQRLKLPVPTVGISGTTGWELIYLTFQTFIWNKDTAGKLLGNCKIRDMIYKITPIPRQAVCACLLLSS